MFGLGRKSPPESERTEPVVTEQAPADSGGTVSRARDRLMVARRQAQRMYQAGKSDRLTGNWPSMPLPADEVVRRNQRVLVARSREQAANNDYARKFLKLAQRNIIGPRGVQLQAQPRGRDGAIDNDAADAIEAAWRRWGKPGNCDVTGRHSWRAIQNACVLSAAKDGEFFLRKIYGRQAGRWGFALQLIDPQRCPPDFDEVRRRDGTFIRAGIEFNQFGRPLAYYFTATEEEEADYSYGGRRFVRVPAGEIIHGFTPEMVGQKRGLPWMATALWRMQMLKGFEDAAVVNARTSASKGGFFEWKDGEGPEYEPDEEELEMQAEPGLFQELPPGLGFKEWNPQYPSGEYAMFVKSALRGVASGMDVAYNTLANDLENVNFSSIRQGALDEREAWKELQEWVIEQLVQPIFDEWLPRQLLAGRITQNGRPLDPARLEALSEVVWQPRRWQWIDPRADVKAAIDSKNNMLASPGQLIRDTGRDPDTVWREVAADIEAMRKAGIPDEMIAAAMSKSLQQPGGTDGQQGQD